MIFYIDFLFNVLRYRIGFGDVQWVGKREIQGIFGGCIFCGFYVGINFFGVILFYIKVR